MISNAKPIQYPFLQDPAANNPEDEPPQPQGRPQCTARYQGNYQGMTAAAAIFDEEDVDKIFPEGVESGVGEVSDYPYEQPLDIVALGLVVEKFGLVQFRGQFLQT